MTILFAAVLLFFLCAVRAFADGIDMRSLDRYIRKKRAAAGVSRLCLLLDPEKCGGMKSVESQCLEALGKAEKCRQYMREAKSEKDWREAMKLLKGLEDFARKDVFYTYCRNNAIRLAIEMRKERMIDFATRAAALVAVAVVVIYIINYNVHRDRYDRAVALFKAGDFAAAEQAFAKMVYEDSREYEKKAKTYKAFDIAGYISLGRYPQGAEGEKEPIRWRILAKDKTRRLVLSEEVLDRDSYEEPKWEREKWKDSRIRQWLMSVFL